MNFQKIGLLGLCFCSTTIVSANETYATEDAPSFNVSSGYMRQNGSDVTYNYDVDDSDLIKSEDGISGTYFDANLRLVMPESHVFSKSYFGSAPVLSLWLSRTNLDADVRETIVSGGGNSPLDVNGDLIGTAFVGGGFDSDFEQNKFMFGGELVGQSTAETLSLVPVIGLHASTREQQHEILGRFTTQPNNPRSLMFSDLDTKMIGVSFGGNLTADLADRLTFTAKPVMNVTFAHSEMTATQDRNSNIGGVADALSRDDNENNFIYEPTLSLGMDYDLSPFKVGLQVKGSYSYGDPKIQLSEVEGQAARIDTDNESFSYAVGLRLTREF